jgi:GPH family glycoside/pentoside/hexuronide:cation symporter
MSSLESVDDQQKGFMLAPPLALREKLSYGIGEVANNLAWTMVGGFLLYYYTNVALLPVAALGTLMLVSRGLDAFIDPFVGLMMDRTNTRFGRAKPYVLFGSIPMGLIAVLTFTSPPHTTTGKLFFAYFTLLVLGALLSLVSIPYGALMMMMTKDTKEKVQLSSLRSVGSSVGAITVTSLVLPMVGYFGHGDAQRGFTMTAIILAITGVAMYALVYFNTEERFVELMDRKAPPIAESIRQLAQNEVFVVTGLFTLVNLLRIGCILALTVYFALLVLRAPWTVPFLFGAMSVGSITSASMASPFFQRLGFRKGNIYVLLFSIGCYCLLPFLEAHPVGFLVGLVFAFIGSQACTTAIFAMVANSADYHEFKFLTRSDGLISSCFSLSTKLGIALGGTVIAFGLAIAHYDSRSITPHAIAAIRGMFYGVPMALMMLQILVVSFYKIDTQHTFIVRTSAERATKERLD